MDPIYTLAFVGIGFMVLIMLVGTCWMLYNVYRDSYDYERVRE